MSEQSDFDIDAAEEEYNKARGEGGGDGEPDELPVPDVEEIDADDLPDGFKSYEDYIAEGGDPDLYVGKKAFQERYKDIESNRQLRTRIQGMEQTQQLMMDSLEDWKSQQAAQIRSEVEAELAQAMEDEDPKAAVAAQQKLDQMDQQAQQTTAPKPEHTVIQDFRARNPVLDKSSEQFNEEFNDDMEAIFNSYAQRGLTRTEGQMKRVLAASMKEAKALHPDLFESPRNKREGQQRQTKRQRQEPKTPKAEDFKIDNPRNPSQAGAAAEVRDMIHKRAFEQAKKNGKSDADAKAFADEHAANFESGLSR